jgi:hypothetical protein
VSKGAVKEVSPFTLELTVVVVVEPTVVME